MALPRLASLSRTHLPLDLAAVPAWEPPGPPEGTRRHRFRTAFISDIHLGTRGCQAELLLDFLASVEVDTLYLIGDIVDGWRLKKSWQWQPAHTQVVRKILKKAKKGTRVIYIPGNHDESLRGFVDHDLAGVELRRDAIHEAADGRKYWICHGDEFDGVVKFAKWLALLGDSVYVALIRLNTAFNLVRRTFGYPYWSLSAFLKNKVKNAVEYISRFEEAVAAEAQRRGLDGVICGHIHHAEHRRIGKTDYYNDGDWVESCTALVEHPDGRFEILYWADEVRARAEVVAVSDLRRLQAAE